MSLDELPRRFGLSTATFVVIASMVGTGILVAPGYMILTIRNYPAIFALWVIGGALAMCGALCVAELAAAMPRAGGEYVYLRQAYGPMPAFLSGWTTLVLGFSGPLAINAHLSATYLLAPFSAVGVHSESFIHSLLAACIIVFMTIPNLLGHRQSAWTQDLTTILKLVLFGALVFAGFAWGTGRLGNLTGGRPVLDIKVGLASTQLFYVMFAYSGWNAATYIAGEINDPGRTLPRSLILGSIVVIVLYLAMNLVYAYAIPLSGVSSAAEAEQVAHLAAQSLFGPRISGAFSIAVGLTLLATVSAYIVTGPRVYYAMAGDRLFFSFAARLDRRTHVPAHAMILQSVCAIVILFTGTFKAIFEYAAVGLSLFSILIIAAVFVLRWRSPDLLRPFRTPGYPFVPALYLLVTLWMACFAFYTWPIPSTISLGSILAGIPLYYVWQRLWPVAAVSGSHE